MIFIILFIASFLLVINISSAAECSGTLVTACSDYGGLGEEACLAHYQFVDPPYLQCAWTDPGPPGGICNPGAECTLPAGDEEYPQFSSYWDDNASLTGSGTAHFNITILSTNGTVQLEIDGTNHTASNITTSSFNVSIPLGSAGDFSYYWLSWGNGSLNNYNVSNLGYYKVNASGDITPPTITFISQTPNDLMWNSTAQIFQVLFNITDTESSINESSIAVFQGVNHTHSDGFTHWNWSYRYPENDRTIDGRRANQRNESKWWESVIYKTEPNDIWTFGGRSSLGIFVNKIDNTSTSAYFNWTETDIHFMYPQMWFLERSEMYKENKTSQSIEIYKNHPVKIAINLTNHDLTENYTQYGHFNIEPQGSSADLIIYFCNSSYVSGKPDKSSDCQAGPHITGSESRNIVIVNSSYIEKMGSMVNGYFGSVRATRQASIILTSDDPTAGDGYLLHYANNSIADITNFNDSKVMWTSDDKGVTWTQYAGTPDFWFATGQADYDIVTYYVYACDNSRNCANSTWQTDTLEKEPNLPPEDATITYPLCGDNVTTPFYINWTTAGDPDSDNYNASVSFFLPNGTLYKEVASNNITDDITYFLVDSLILTGNYWINITLCDFTNSVTNCSSTMTGCNFTIHDTTSINITQSLDIDLFQGRKGLLDKGIDSPISITDIFNRFFGGSRDSNQGINFDSIQNKIGNWFRDTIQNLKLNSIINKFRGLFGLIIQKLNIDLVTDRIGNFKTSISQLLNINIILNRIGNLFRTTPQSINVNEDVKRKTDLGRDLSQTISIENIMNRFKGIPRTINQILNLNTLVSRTENLMRVITQKINIAFKTVTSDFLIFLKSITQSLNMGESIERITDLGRDLIQSINIDFITNRINKLFRKTIQNIQVDNVVDRFKGIFKNINEKLELNSVVNRVSVMFRSINERLQVKSITTSLIDLIRNITQRLNIDFIFERLGKFWRVTDQEITTESEIGRLRNVWVSISQKLNIQSITERLGIFGRVIKQILEFFGVGINIEETPIILGSNIKYIFPFEKYCCPYVQLNLDIDFRDSGENYPPYVQLNSSIDFITNE